MRTTTIATIGPSSSEREILASMIEHGVRIFRLNFSHAPAEEFAPIIELIRDLERELGTTLTVLGDLSGPKIRIGKVENAPLQLSQGDRVYLGPAEHRERYRDLSYLPLDMPEVLAGLDRGAPVTISDGVPRFTVSEVLEPDRVFLLRAQDNGIVSSSKGITFPGKPHSLPAFTDKDKHDLHAGLEVGVDAFAQSFVQTREDMETLRSELTPYSRYIPLIAKLERASSLENLDSILSLADGMMVARGDLGLECSLPALPVIQKKVVRACRRHQKPAIVATQMLLSMVNNPLPTRAEATDVANAIMDGTDCVMLSEETAVGSYPIGATQMIRDIADHAESYLLQQMQGPYRPENEKDTAKYLAYSACLMADHAEGKGVACHSTSGRTAALLSSRRASRPVYALTPHVEVMRSLNFYWGVIPVQSDAAIPNHLDRVEQFVEKSDLFAPGDRIVLTSGQPTPGQRETHTNQIKIYAK
jgi:pyruvate kinase